MNTLNSTLVKNLIVAAALGLAAVASWAITDYRAPSLEASVTTPTAG